MYEKIRDLVWLWNCKFTLQENIKFINFLINLFFKTIQNLLQTKHNLYILTSFVRLTIIYTVENKYNVLFKDQTQVF